MPDKAKSYYCPDANSEALDGWVFSVGKICVKWAAKECDKCKEDKRKTEGEGPENLFEQR